MSFFEKKYEFLGWDENIYSMTARNLYERVVKDSQSDYNWIAPATELVRVCKESRFPEKYAQTIKLLILNCFANLELMKKENSIGLKTDQATVNFCYNSLPNTHEAVIMVKQKYLAAVITAITNLINNRGITIHQGVEYDKICSEWRKAKFYEYASIEEIDFNQFRKDLYADYINMLAEKGILDEADKEYEKDEIDKLFLEDLSLSALSERHIVCKIEIPLK